MSYTKQGWGAYPGNPYQNAQQWGGYAGGPPPGGPGPGPGERRIDALDVIEGVLKDGLSLSNFTRIARASGSNFWLGAAIGAGLVVLINRPDVRAAVSGIFTAAKGSQPTGATTASPPAPAPEPPKT